ncbi:uncharacterized protein AB675_7382 [Cyphellophora attinorum]|uniref:Xylose isomerase-like TIM barrel domain-containing protein n=1 Tax=Cyphellophora attinorum TaxID=1664694 RepID=A0A0N1H3N6_9EURO|nr:uncharacterized protein AB675_7382 [Phialophora attinorum]KPI36324.1 hypothetical protein AB675_7382 [Phialophora attinorum]
MKGPAIFLIQYVDDKAPFNTLPSIAKWAADLGYMGIQLPVDERLIDIDRAANDLEYCKALKAELADIGVEITELSSHLVGQLIAVHPAYDMLYDDFAPAHVRGKPDERRAWAHETMLKAAKASHNLGLTAHATFSGALAWPYWYPWPQRPAKLVDTAFAELAKRWLPILDAFDKAGVDVCYEIMPGEDLFDGYTFDKFRVATGNHPRVNMILDASHLILQQMDYLSYIDHYHQYIKIFHVKDAEYHSDGKQGVYGGYASWRDRVGTVRAIGDGQVDFRSIFTKLYRYGYQGWAIFESECAFKDMQVSAAEAAVRITDLMVPMAAKAFDDFAGSKEAHTSGHDDRSDPKMAKLLGFGQT